MCYSWLEFDFSTRASTKKQKKKNVPTKNLKRRDIRQILSANQRRQSQKGICYCNWPERDT